MKNIFHRSANSPIRCLVKGGGLLRKGSFDHTSISVYTGGTDSRRCDDKCKVRTNGNRRRMFYGLCSPRG